MKKKIGVRTRLIRFLPGAFNTEVFVHDYWEEVYMISGSITLGNDHQEIKKSQHNLLLMHADLQELIMGHSDLMKDVCF